MSEVGKEEEVCSVKVGGVWQIACVESKATKVQNKFRVFTNEEDEDEGDVRIA